MIGFRSIRHQGHAGARSAKPDAEHNPYPKGCAAFYEYQDGCGAYRAGKAIDGRGNIVEPVARRPPNEANFRHGADW